MSGIAKRKITLFFLDKLPYSIRVLVESGVRNCDGFHVTKEDVEKIYDWEEHQKNEQGVEVSFKPSRVILQDFTGVPALVDFAAMRDAINQFGGNPMTINPICPADLVIDHSVQVDFARRYLLLNISKTIFQSSPKFQQTNKGFGLMNYLEWLVNRR